MLQHGGKAGLLAVRSASFLGALLFLSCICYFKRVQNASIFRLFLDAPELRAQDSCRAAQNDSPADETFPAASLPLSWDGASISGPIMRGASGGVQACLLRFPTSQTPLPGCGCCWCTHQRPRGAAVQEAALSFLFSVPEMGCLDAGWGLLAGNGRVGSFLPARKSSCSFRDRELDLRAREGPLCPCPRPPKRVLCEVSPCGSLPGSPRPRVRTHC